VSDEANNKANEPANDKATGKEEKDKSKFDWVTARSQCSLPNVFHALRLEVEEDVKTRNALCPNNSPYEFSVVEEGDHFIALLEAKDVRRSVRFSLAEHAILVRDDQGQKTLDVIVFFTDDGQCRLKVNEKELELWQVRRMALEELMFRSY
jgi:hypothetical protein